MHKCNICGRVNTWQEELPHDWHIFDIIFDNENLNFTFCQDHNEDEILQYIFNIQHKYGLFTKKEIVEWAQNFGFEVIDYDGFDRTDKDIENKSISIFDFAKGYFKCTIKIFDMQLFIERIKELEELLQQ